MPASPKVSPALCAGCGAALSYYLLFPLARSGHLGIDALLLLIFAPAAALCFVRVLASCPFPLARDCPPRAARALRVLPALLAAFAGGLALGASAGAGVSTAPALGLPAESVTGISGVLLDDPRLVSGGSAMATLSLRAVFGAGGVRASAGGEVVVFFREGNAERLREFGRGTEVFAEGRLQSRAAGSFGGGLVFSADSLHVTAAASPIDSFRTGLRRGLADRFAGHSEGDAAWGGLALALLLGIRDNLDSGLADLYRAAGISYILALSGMHLAVIIALVSFLLKKPLGMRPAAIAGALVIVAYCFVVGPLPSLYRSALMYVLGVLAVLGMLKRNSLSILSMAFLIQLAFAPQAGGSLSFVLSYLAMVGIFVTGKSLGGIFKGVIPPFLLGPLALSLGAFIGTAGVVALVFGDLRPAGIFAGLVVAPLTTAFMVVSIIWLAIDVALPGLSPLLAWPLSMLYRLMEETARLAGFLPGLRANPYLVVLLSLLVSAALVWLDLRLRARRDRLEPFAD